MTYMNEPNVIGCPYAPSDNIACAARDGRLAVADDGLCIGCERQVAELFKTLVSRHVNLRDRLDRLERAAGGAKHLCLSLLAMREGATDDLIEEVREALDHALAASPDNDPRHFAKFGAGGAGTDIQGELLAIKKAEGPQ